MKLYLIAGEASGDLHGSNLIKALKKQQPALRCRAWGGDLMQAAGAEVVKHYRDLAFMGFWEVLKNLQTILRNFRQCKADVLAFRPDAIVLIDYPGFNLRMAKWAKKRGIRVIYYISPQLWAWHASRVHTIKRTVDRMLVILPFETDFYKQYGMTADFVGHPLLDSIPPPDEDAPRAAQKQITLLPGSRVQEIRRILPPMLSVTPFFPEYQFVIAAASGLSADIFQPFMAAYPNVRIAFNQTYDLLRQSEAALVKSGTSTLETALLGTPQVVCYAGSPLSFAIAKRLVNVRYISLVNLVLDRPLVRELIQEELNSGNLRAALDLLLQPSENSRIREGYRELRKVLGTGGASERAAQIILSEGLGVSG